MKLSWFSFLFFGILNAQEPDSSSAVFGIMDAERNFAKTSVSEGVKIAFVNNLSDDAIVFRPGPVKGRPIWQNRKPPVFSLKWEPEFCDAAASGDFGYSTGPSEFSGWRPHETEAGHGYFTSIWKKHQDGVWRVVLDIGISTPKPDSMCKFTFLPGSDKIKTNKGSGKTDDLIKMDKDFAEAWKKSTDAMKFFATHARIHRTEKLPTTGLDGVKIALASIADCSPEFAEVASSNDMGYVYGQYKKTGETGWYLRIWKKTDSWKIVLDLQSPNPPGKK